MQCSLLSRFRGLFLGAVLGEAYAHHQTQSDSTPVPASWSARPPGTPEFTVCLSQTIATATTTLLQQQWQPATATPVTLPCEPTESEALVALLPVILYLHETPMQLRLQLPQYLPPAATAELEGTTGVLAGAIAHMLQEQCQPETLIPHLLADLSPPDTLLSQQLRTVQTLLHARTSLNAAVQALVPAAETWGVGSAIALALYCWLSTPEHWLLSVQRISRIPDAQVLPSHKVLSAVLTGALSGVYNGQFGIATPWQLHQMTAVWDPSLPSPAEILSLGDQLLAAWSGCLQPLDMAVDAEKMQGVAISAPGVMRFTQPG